MRQHLTLQHPRAACDDIDQNRGHDGIQNAFAIHQPSAVQSTKPRTSKRGLRAVVAVVQVHTAITARSEIPPQLIDDLTWQGLCQVLPEGFLVAGHGAGQVSRHQQTNRPRWQAPEEFRVPLEEQPKIHRCATREEIQKDVGTAVVNNANRELLREVADGLFVRGAERQRREIVALNTGRR